MRKTLKFLIVSGFCVFVVFGCVRHEDDVTFAKKTMEQLIEGRYAVRTRIDWPNLKIGGFDVGSRYSSIKKEEDKNSYERSFIKGFSENYSRQGGKLSSFFGWRPSEYKFENVNYKVVAAYFYDKSTTFLFFLSEEKGQRKLIEILFVRQNIVQEGA